MSLIKAYGDSQAADNTSNNDTATGPKGNPAALGYIEVDNPSQKPAQLNSDVANTKGNSTDVGKVNEGTNLDAYSYQGGLADAEAGTTSGGKA